VYQRIKYASFYRQAIASKAEQIDEPILNFKKGKFALVISTQRQKGNTVAPLLGNRSVFLRYYLLP
jgi:hypothetical protein